MQRFLPGKRAFFSGFEGNPKRVGIHDRRGYDVCNRQIRPSHFLASDVDEDDLPARRQHEEVRFFPRGLARRQAPDEVGIGDDGVLLRFGNIGLGRVDNEGAFLVFRDDPVGIGVFVDPHEGEVGRYRQIPAFEHFSIALVDVVLLAARDREEDIAVTVDAPFLDVFFRREVDALGNPHEIVGPIPIRRRLGRILVFDEQEKVLVPFGFVAPEPVVVAEFRHVHEPFLLFGKDDWDIEPIAGIDAHEHVEVPERGQVRFLPVRFDGEFRFSEILVEFEFLADFQDDFWVAADHAEVEDIGSLEREKFPGGHVHDVRVLDGSAEERAGFLEAEGEGFLVVLERDGRHVIEEREHVALLLAVRVPDGFVGSEFAVFDVERVHRVEMVRIAGGLYRVFPVREFGLSPKQDSARRT